MDWKQNFDQTALMEGYRLFDGGLVGDLHQSGDLYQAIVYDPWSRTNQRVRARIEEGAVEALECTCPDARHGLCRHEAAFLFGIENGLTMPSSDPEASASKRPQAAAQPQAPKASGHTPDAGLKSTPDAETRSESDRKAAEKKPKTFEDYLLELARRQAELEGTVLDESDSQNLSAMDPFSMNEDPIAQAFPFQGAHPVEEKPASDSFSANPPLTDDRNKADRKPDEQPVQAGAKRPEPEPVKPSSADLKPAAPDPFDQASPVSSEPEPEKQKDRPVSKDPKPEEPDRKQPGSSLSALINSLSEQQIRDFLFREARKTPAFRLRLELEFLREAPEELLDTYYSGLDALLYSHQDSSGLIPKAGETQFLQVMATWLLSRLSLLIEHDYPAQAFALIQYAFEALDDLRFENPKQSAQELLKSLCGELAAVLQEADLSLSDSIFTWMEMELVKPHLGAALKQDLLQILDSAFLQQRYTAAKLKLLETLLESETKKMENSRFDATLRNQIIRQIYALFASTDEYPQEKEAFEKEAEDSSVLQDLKIQQAIALDDLETARVLLAESLRTVPSGSLEAAVRMRRLAALLNEEGRKKEALETLKALMSRNPHLVASDLMLYKDLVEEDEFLSAMKSLHHFASPLVLGEVYAASGYDDELMSLIEDRSDLLLLEQYEERLAPSHAPAMIALWLGEAKSRAASGDSRSYPAVIYALEKAASLPEGLPAARKTAAELKETYSHKRSLVYRLEESGLIGESSEPDGNSQA